MQRLANIRGKKQKTKISDKKLKGGLSVNIFKDFLIVGNTSYSLQHVVHFSIRNNEGNVALEQFISKHMLVEDPTYHQLIFVGSGQRATAFTHSGAFVRRTVNKKGKQTVVVGFQQQEYDAPIYMPPNVIELSEALEFHRDFVIYQEMDLYEIKGRNVNNLNAKKILKDVEWVITGKKTTDKDARIKKSKAAREELGAKGWQYGDDELSQ